MNKKTNDMRKILVVLSIVIGAFACKSDEQRKSEQLIERINAIGLSAFDRVEYSVVGEDELYSYLQKDTAVVSWKYNRLHSKFEEIDVQKLAKQGLNGSYPDTLRARIQRLNIEGLTQTGFDGKVKRFWLNDAEIVIWRSPDLRSDEKTIILDNELASFMKVTDQWYYHRMKVCRNK